MNWTTKPIVATFKKNSYKNDNGDRKQIILDVIESIHDSDSRRQEQNGHIIEQEISHNIYVSQTNYLEFQGKKK